jgi:succinoglycan biosynthesis transport protein ExoP
MGEEAAFDFRRYLRGLRRRARLIVLVVLVLVNVTLVLSLRQERVYEGDAKVLLSPQMFGDRTGFQVDAALAVQTEIQLFESDPVRALVVEQLGPVGKVSAERVNQTLLVSVKARSRDPKRAAAVTNAYARAYLQFRSGLDGTAPADSTGPSSTAISPGSGRLVAPASVPDHPVKPRPVRDAALAGVTGLLLGLGLASLLEALDDSVKTRAELQKVTDLSVLGVIPSAPHWNEDAVLADEGSPAVSEAFRALRTSVQLLGIDRPIRTLQVTSGGSGEGKTTVVASLALVLARAGQRVVVVDADLRRPRLHEVFRLSNRVGVTSVLVGETDALGAVQRVPGEDNLGVLASGPLPPNPSELLASKKMAQLVFALGSQFEMVIIDCTPVLPVTDATVVSTWAEGTILVCRSGTTTRRQLQTALELLRQANAPLAGCVLNQASLDEVSGGGYSYHYYYERDPNIEAGRTPTLSTLTHRQRDRSPEAGRRPTADARPGEEPADGGTRWPLPPGPAEQAQ